MLDVTTTVISWLIDNGVDAYCEVPPDRPREFCVVQRTGGGRTGVVCSPTAAVDCWAATQLEANTLGGKVERLLAEMPDGIDNVFTCEINSFYENPDPDTGSPRVSLFCVLQTND